MAKSEADVIVVGAGNAAFCAALAAQEQGASVLMLEAAPEEESGGNSRFTAGSVRVVYNGVDDIKALVPDLTDQEIATTDFGTYTREQFFDDMARVTQNRADPDLVELLVTRSFDTFCWMRNKGVRFIPIYGRQAFKIEGKFKFWGGLTVEAVGGGPGLIKMLTDAATKRGIEIRYRTRALSLLYDGVRVAGVRIRHDGAESELRSKSVVPVRHSRQRHRQALRRRRRRLPQLHLRQIWPRGAGAAGPVRLAGLRPEGEASAARRVQDPADHQGRRRLDRGIRTQARGRERGAVPQDHRRVQQGGAPR